MRSIRGLYVVRSGGGGARLSTPVRAEGDDASDTEGEAPDDGRLATLEVDFSRFGEWYEIDSLFEGRYLERIQKGAFKKTFAERGDQVRVLFNHGMDFSIDQKAISVPEVLEERDDAPHLEGPLLDTSYNRDLLPGLRAGAYGSSFMFEVLGEEWREEPGKSQHNPDGLPERTISEVRLFEAGPVTWPANPAATAGVRAGTDWLIEQIAERDQDRYDELVRSFAAFRALHRLGTRDQRAAAPAQTSDPEPPAPGQGRHVDGVAMARKRARQLALIDMET